MGGSFDDESYTIAEDSAGNIYTTGLFKGTVDFDPGPGTMFLTSLGSSLSSSKDIFVQKLDSAGNFIWAKRIGGNSFDESWSIAMDVVGDIYITGSFRGITDFDPGPGTFTLNSLNNYDIFVLKLKSNGDFDWVKQMGSSFYDAGYDIFLDDSGYVYTTGSFQLTVDFNPDPGMAAIDTLTAVSASDIFVQKLDTAGNFIWAKAMGGTRLDQGYSLVVDDLGNVYVTGTFENTADFDPGVGVASLISTGNPDTYIVKLDINGDFVWVKQIAGFDNNIGTSIALDELRNVYITGGFDGTLDFDPGAGTAFLTSAGRQDAFIQKLDFNGNYVWAKRLGGALSDQANSIFIDQSSDIYVTGNFEATGDFDPGSGVYNLVSSGASDVFVCKLDNSGNFLWGEKMGGTNNEYGGTSIVAQSGSVYTIGTFQGTADFNPGNGIFNLSSAGGRDIFINKLEQCQNNISIDTQIVCGSYTWIDGVTYTASNDTATHIIPNLIGCDLLVKLDLTLVPLDTSVTQNGLNLNANLAAANYQWLDCNNGFSIIPGETNQQFTATQSGSYAVEISQNTCIDTSICYPIIGVGILDYEIGDQISLFPNPTNDQFSIDLGNVYSNVSVIIKDLNGRVIQFNNFNNTQILDLEIEGATGLYFVTVEIENKAFQLKLVKT